MIALYTFFDQSIVFVSFTSAFLCTEAKKIKKLNFEKKQTYEKTAVGPMKNP